MESTAKVFPGQISDFNNLKKPGKDGKFLFSLPEVDKPLICKLLRDPRSGNPYVPMAYYSYMVGPDPEKHSRSRPSLLSLKKLAADPEKEEFWRIRSEIKELKKTHNAEHPQVKALEAKAKIYSARECGWLYYIEPNSDVIKSVKVGPDVINQLFGKEATTYKPAVVSVLDTLAKQGRSPYDLNNESGWLSLSKSGKGLATRYHVSLATYQGEMKDQETGEVVLVPKPIKATIHSRILTEGVELSEFPDPIKLEERGAFTLEETATFISSSGTSIPARFLPNGNNNDGPREVNEDYTPSHSTPALASLDDIPF